MEPIRVSVVETEQPIRVSVVETEQPIRVSVAETEQPIRSRGILLLQCDSFRL